MLASIPDAVVIADAEGIRYANDAARELLRTDPAGLTFEALIQRFELTHVDGSAMTTADLAAVRALAEEGIARAEYALVIEGRPVVVSSSACPLRGAARPSALVAWRDVSERHAADKGREQLLERLRAASDDYYREHEILVAITNSTDAHLAYLDIDFNFVEVNEAYARGSGHTREELLGHNHFELFPNAENEAIFRRVRDSGEPVEFHAKPFEYPDQPWRGVTYWDWRLTPVKRDGKVIGFAFSLVDVTDSIRSQRFNEALNKLNDVIHSELEFDPVVTHALPELAAAMHVEVVGVLLRSGEGEWRVVDAVGMPKDVRGRTIPEEDFAASVEAMRAGRIVSVSDPDDPRLRTALVRAAGLKSIPVAPISLPAEEIGVLAFAYTSGPGSFDETQRDFAAKVAASLSLALTNSRLFAAERRSARTAAALNRVNEILLSTLTVDEMLERIVVESSEVVGADKAIVADLQGDYVQVRHVSGFPRETVGARLLLSDFPAVERAIRGRQPQLIENATSDESANRRFALQYGNASFMTLPLEAAGRVTGALSYVYSEPQQFDEHDVELARRLSVAMSLALENARRFETERSIADRLQEALLTVPDSVPGIDFAHAYHAASEAARVGGDFYDVFEIEHDLVGITIGDVAGKGLDAAVLTSLVKNTIRAHAHEKGAQPAEIMRLTNDIVYSNTSLESFVTVFFGVLDRRDGRLVYTNGGHTTAAVLRHASVEAVPATGPIVGAFRDVTFEQGEMRLEPNEMLILYTDGLTEARRDGRLYGEERLFDLVGGMRTQVPLEVVGELVEDVVDYARHRLEDDLAIVAIRPTGHAEDTASQQRFEV